MLPGSFRHAPWEMKKATVQVHHGLCVYTSPVRWMPARVQRRRTHFGLQCPCAQKRTLCIAQTSRRFVLLFYTSPFFARNQCLLRTFGKRHKKPPVPAGFFGVFIKGLPPVQPCVRSANFAPHSPASACGAACTCSPGRPALTQTVPCACAEMSNTVGYAFFMPSGLHPPRI